MVTRIFGVLLILIAGVLGFFAYMEAGGMASDFRPDRLFEGGDATMLTMGGGGLLFLGLLVTIFGGGKKKAPPAA